MSFDEIVVKHNNPCRRYFSYLQLRDFNRTHQTQSLSLSRIFRNVSKWVWVLERERETISMAFLHDSIKLNILNRKRAQFSQEFSKKFWDAVKHCAEWISEINFHFEPKHFCWWVNAIRGQQPIFDIISGSFRRFLRNKVLCHLVQRPGVEPWVALHSSFGKNVWCWITTIYTGSAWFGPGVMSPSGLYMCLKMGHIINLRIFPFAWPNMMNLLKISMALESIQLCFIQIILNTAYKPRCMALGFHDSNNKSY